MKRIELEKENNKDETSGFQRRICSYTLKSAIVLAVLFVILQESSMAKGLLLGTICSIINFLLLGVSVPMALGQTRNRAGLIGFVSLIIRYVLLAIPLIIGIKLSSVNFIAVIIGIFAVQIVTLIDHIVIRPIFTDK